MPTAEIHELMSLYARRGLEEWGRRDDVRRRAERLLTPKRIASNRGELDFSLTPHRISDRLMLLPMPSLPTRDFECCLFAPIHQTADDGGLNYSFDLWLLISGEECLAFRFEPAHPDGEAHDYSHVQFSRRLLRGHLDARVPSWLPHSYPAFPATASDPVHMFLYMLTSVHGHSGGILKLLVEIFQAEGKPQHVKPYLEALQRLLGEP